MNLEVIVQTGTLVSILIAAIGLIHGIKTYHRQQNAQLFIEYTKRYQGIMDSFPADAHAARLRLDGEPPTEYPQLTMSVLRYLNLCSEEYYLWNRGYLDDTIWQIWHDELERTLRSPLLRREWQQLRSEFQSYPGFSRYVDTVQHSG